MSENLNLDKINVEKVDIISEFHFYMNEMRKIAVKGCDNKDKISGYDVGVENAVKVLEMLLKSGDGEIRDRLIYHKHGEHDSVRRFIPLDEAVKEIIGGDHVEQ